MKKLIKECLCLLEIITDGFDITAGEIKFNRNNNNINTAFGKNKKLEPRKTTLKKSKVEVFSAYSKNSGESRIILKALKGNYDIKISNEELQKFINRTSIYFSRLLQGKPIDMIIQMDSSSTLVDMLTSKSLEKLSHSNIINIKDILKKDLSNIQLSKNTKFSNNEILIMNKIIEKAKQTGKLELKTVPGKLRSGLENFIKIKEEYKSKIENKHILIIDDYLTSGTTLDEACIQLLKLNPKSIIGLTILK